MTKAQQRQIALGAARSYMRQMGINPIERSVKDAEAALDDLSRQDRSLVAAKWWSSASSAQVATFRREWEAYRQRGY